MKCATRKLRPAVKWHGGKTYLARRIIALFPEHDTYVEPFAGGLSVLLNKPSGLEECASDLNRGLIRTYRAIQDYPSAVIEGLRSVQYDAETFKAACYAVEHPTEDGVDWAVNFIIKNRFSRGGLGKDFAWSDRLRGGQPGDVNAWKTIVDDLPLIAHRLKGVRLLNCPAASVVRDWDHPTTLIYCDPPYCHDTRTVSKVYDHEMDIEDHADFLKEISRSSSMVFLSGYRNRLYDTVLNYWKRYDFDMPNHSGQGKTKQRRVECVWTNTESGVLS